MRTPHVAILTLMANGHVYPVLPLCSELIKRGYRVTYATTDHYLKRIRAAGAEPVLFYDISASGSLEEEYKLLFSLPFDDPRWVNTDLRWSHFCTSTTSVISQVHRFYATNVPDLIIYDQYFYTGRILATRLSRPAIQVSAHFARHRNLNVQENGIGNASGSVVEYEKRLDDFLAVHGVHTKGNLWHSEELNVHFIPKEFQHHSDVFDKKYCFVGRTLDPPGPQWKNNSNGRPILLVSAFSGPTDVRIDMASTSYFRTIIEALSAVDCHCVLSIGDNVSVQSLGALPTNFEINQHAPHAAILPHVALSICHAGMGSALEAIYNGVPLLAIPVHPAAVEVGDRVAELGLGVHLPQDMLTVETIRCTVTNMLADTSLLSRVKLMQLVFNRSGGVKLAADKIDEFVAQLWRRHVS